MKIYGDDIKTEQKNYKYGWNNISASPWYDYGNWMKIAEYIYAYYVVKDEQKDTKKYKSNFYYL
jgi:hypothetical protein